MEALKKKFKSRRGASILLAMLFLLVCIMVGASVMMAAASNVGKTQSNKEEQQKYLTLSSAMTMLVDELKSVSYVGNYTYYKTEVRMDAGGEIIKDSNNAPQEFETGDTTIPENSTVAYHVHHYIQDKGDLTGGSWLKLNNGVLPLRDYLDHIFASNFSVPTEDQIVGDRYDDDYYEPLSPTTSAPADGDILEFTVDDSGYGDLSEDKVRITVTLRKDGSILLEATLWEPVKDDAGHVTSWKETAYTMEALLRPDLDDSDDSDDWLEKLLVLPGSPEAKDNTTETITWKLEYVFKQAKKGADPDAPDAP